MPPPTLSYAKPDAPAVPRRAVVALLLGGAGVCLLTTLWWRLGIAYGQRVEGQEFLFPAMTGTTFWETWVIVVPEFFLLLGLAGPSVFVIVQVARRRWSAATLWVLPVYATMFLITILANAELIDRVFT